MNIMNIETTNKRDSMGFAQGLWRNYFLNREVWWEGYAVDGNIEGELLEYEHKVDIDKDKINQRDSLVKRQGLWKHWYDNGQLWWECYYANDNRHGLWRQWHLNGQLAFEGYYINDQEQGLWRQWRDNGKLWWEWYYVNGVLEGEEIMYEY